MTSSSLPPRADRRRAVRRSLIAVAALSALSACGTADPGITVTNAQSDVVFAGASASPSTSSVPATGPTEGGAFTPSLPNLPSSFPTLKGFDNNNPPFQFPEPGGSTAPARSNICPGPPVFASAPTAATTYVEGQPKPGFYLWQLLTTEDLGSNIKSTTAKYTNYEIKNVSPITTRPNPSGDPTSVFTYDLVAPIGKGSTITYTMQVKQNAQGANVSTGNVGKPTRVSEPDAGVAIAKEVQRNSAGDVTGQFSPSIPVLILPLPVQGGADFRGAGTDPSTGASMQVAGTVKGPDRVSGCSEFVQGIRADVTVTSQAVPSQAAATVDEVITVETQSGGLVVGTAQTPTNSKTTTLTVVGETRPTTKARDIPKEQQA